MFTIFIPLVNSHILSKKECSTKHKMYAMIHKNQERSTQSDEKKNIATY